MRLSTRICLVVLAAYAAAAVFGEIQYRVAKVRDVTPAYNVVNTSARYLPPCSTVAIKQSDNQTIGNWSVTS